MKKIFNINFNKFCRWMKYDPPNYLSSNNWDLFNNEFREIAPFRYLIICTIPRKVIYPVRRILSDINYWILVRTFYKSHIVKPDLKPGWIERDNLLLWSSFKILQEYVEVDLATCNFDKTAEVHNIAFYCRKYIPYFAHIFKYKNINDGIKYLEWETTLDDPNLPQHQRSVVQAISAREILSLYNWWVKERPLRKEFVLPEFDDQGCISSCLDPNFNTSASDYIEYLKVYDDNITLHEIWEKEDTDNLIRLAKIRNKLWV